MQSILDIRVQKLFLITLILKVGASVLGWQLGSPWILGLSVPLALMATYIFLGLKRHDRDVSDEKFADSCYYLGFIFTITSIIVSLFDIHDIGTKMQDIAVRFGAAMISTVFGLAVRVALVNFRKDATDAIRDAEDAIVEASQRFREQLVIAFETLRSFEVEVDNAAKQSVQRVNLQVDALSKNHAQKLSGFFEDLTVRNQEAFTQALEEVKTASLKLSSSVDSYSNGMRANLSSIEAKVTNFTDAISNRLKTTTFPDDYFSGQLEAPLAQLTSSAKAVSDNVKTVASEVKSSSSTLSSALKALDRKANAAEGSLDKVLQLTVQQHAVLEAAQGQIAALERLASTLSGFDAVLATTASRIDAGSEATSELTNRMAALVAESGELRKNVSTALAEVVGGLSKTALATDSVAHQLVAAVAATEGMSDRLDNAASANLQATKSLGVVGQHAITAIEKVETAAERLQAMVHQLAAYGSLPSGSPQQGGSEGYTTVAVHMEQASAFDPPAISHRVPGNDIPHAIPPATLGHGEQNTPVTQGTAPAPALLFASKHSAAQEKLTGDLNSDVATRESDN